MKRWLTCSCCLFGLVKLVTQVAADTQETDPPKWQTILQWDNDLMTGRDQDYTNGARIAFMREFAPNEPIHNFFQKALYRLSGVDSDARLHQLRFPNGNETRFAWGVGVTQLMFTPKDHRALRAPKGERPYAGWLGAEASLHAKNEQYSSSVTLSLGTTGPPSNAQETQDWVHQHISGSPIFQGWDSQVPAEFTVNLHLDHKRRLPLFDELPEWPIQFDGYTEWGAALGNFRTDAYLGTLWRAGYNLPATYSTPRVQLGSYGNALFQQEDPTASPFSILSFAGLRATAVMHDITLDGPVFRNFNTGVESEPLVGELIYGIGLRYGRVDLSLSQTLRSDEFKGQNENQTFGSIMLRFYSTF